MTSGSAAVIDSCLPLESWSQHYPSVRKDGFPSETAVRHVEDSTDTRLHIPQRHSKTAWNSPMSLRRRKDRTD